MWAEFLNEHCQCVGADFERLLAAFSGEGGYGRAGESGPGPADLFAEHPVFVDEASVRRIEAAVAAALEVVSLPRFVAQAIEVAPDLARVDQRTSGILHGFDFHVTADGPKLIEINTNAGGALLNLLLSQTQRACCDAVQPFITTPRGGEAVELASRLVAGFRNELARARGAGNGPRRIAIVDDEPEGQFLYTEFRLFAALFQKHGIDATIVDPRELSRSSRGLEARGKPVDLVYNRSTDFYFEQESSRVLREAYLADEVVVTPAPRHHALLANKRHLAVLGDEEALLSFGASPDLVATLTSCVPPAEVVAPEHRDRLYRERKKLFFKPLVGFASKAAYRGDKLTRTKFDEVMAGEYLAQQIVTPSERTVTVAGQPKKMKLDLRAYVVDSRVLLFAARLYQGQTTNFRTSGGGFATVLAIPPHFGDRVPSPRAVSA